MCTYDVGIIGAGPCGIACAISAAKLGKKVIIFECGNGFEDRCCSIDEGKECTNCQYCNVISGFGGCVHYGDAAKLSYYPSGKALYEKLSYDYDRIRDEACKLWNVDSKNDFISNVIETNEYEFSVKQYPVCVTSSKQIKEQINCFWRELKEEGVEYVHGEMCDFLKEDELFRVQLKNKTVFLCKKLVMAVGRKGMDWLRFNLKEKGVNIENPISSIGFRFEVPKEYLRDLGSEHPDFKIRTIRDNVKYKSFCFCGGVNGGRLKFLNYGRYTLLDGHVLSDSDRESKYGNFALLRQVILPDNVEKNYHQYIEDILLEYERISKGKPIYQSYHNFSNMKDEGSEVDMSVACVESGPVYKLLNGDLQQYCDVAREIFEYIAHRNNVDIEVILSQVNVVGLEIEGMWDKVITDDNFMTNIENLYFGGDCGGETQGILQATMMGIKIGEVI